MVVKNIDRNAYENGVITSGGPTLLCFFNNFSIEELSRQFESIQFYVAQDEDLDFFFEKLHFRGTPMFIFFVNVGERARLLGKVSTDRLRVFIESNISNSLNISPSGY